jgi:Spy/CpxP family protein refolding chaperone
MKLRKLFLCVMAFAAIVSTSLLNAQEEKKGKGGRGGGMMTVERLEEAVGKLSAEQKTKIEAIYAKAREQAQGLSQEERQTKGREINQAARIEVRALLTPEQQKKFDEIPQGGRGKKN